VLAFAAALSILTGLFFGLMPALRISRVNIGAGLKEARHSASEGPRQHRLRSLLVVTQTAVAVVLTLAATLLMASYLRLTHVAPGFDHSNVLTFNLDLPSTQYTPERALAFFDDLLGRLKQLPDVNAAAASWPVPFAGGDPSSGFEVEGRQYRAGLMPSARVHIISPGYFQTMRIRMDGGRDFTDHDVMSSLPIAIVDEAFAQTYFPNENALHKRIRPGIAMSDVPPWREIVGIVNSTKERALAEDFQPQYYIPYAQLPGPEPGVVVKTAGSPLTIAPLLPRLLASMDKTVPVYDVRTMDERLSLSVESERFNAFLFGLFGILAAVLAAVGIYGVANCTVNQAVHEIGIRMALGAQAGDVLRLTLIKAARNVAIGIAAGIAVALTLSRLLTTLLYGVKPNDPAMLLAACTGFAIVALIASYIPARRATRIDPMAVLRNE
jgi:putative ABC transport system permease protein